MVDEFNEALRIIKQIAFEQYSDACYRKTTKARAAVYEKDLLEQVKKLEELYGVKIFEEDEEEPHICQTCESDEGLCQVCYERKNTVPICNRCGEPIGLTASVVYEDDDSKIYCGPCRAFIVAHKQYLYWL